VNVVRAFIEDYMDAAGDPRTVRQALKRVEKLALDSRLSRVAFTYDIDVLASVPLERIAYSRFHREQWPRIIARLESKREKFAALKARQKILAATRAGRRRS
jgi:hypothetical protein